jgi:hypothetical protein
MRYVVTALLAAAFLFLTPAWSQTPVHPFDPRSCTGCASSGTVEQCTRCIGGYQRYNAQQATMWCRRMQPKCMKGSSSILDFSFAR